jgi:addiction module HigA family antidote
MRMYNPAHPGIILKEYMGDNITVSALAKHLGMTRANLSMILNGRLGISASVATKISEAFPNSDAEFWLGLQNQYDLAQVAKRKRAKIAPILKKAA